MEAAQQAPAWIPRRASHRGGACAVALALAAAVAWAQAIEPAPRLPLTARAPGAMWAYVTWPAVAGATQYILRHRPLTADRPQPWSETRLLAPRALLRELSPQTRYELAVIALEPAADGGGERPLASGSLTITTAADTPRLWDGLSVGPSRALLTHPGALWPALAAFEGRLYLFEVVSGGIYLSVVDPQAGLALEQWPLLPGTEGVERLCLDACAQRDRLWLTWIERPRAGGAESARPPAAQDTSQNPPEGYLMLASWTPAQPAPLSPLEVARARWGSVTSGGDRLLLAWIPPLTAGAKLVCAPFDADTGLGDAALWGLDLGRPAQCGIARFMGDAAVVVSAPAQRPNGEPVEQAGPTGALETASPLWYASFNGRAFGGLRLVHRLGSNLAPRAAELEGALYVAFCDDAAYPQAPGEVADLRVVRLEADGASLSATILDGDGAFNGPPSIVALGESVWVAYSKRPPGPWAGEGLESYGSFLTRIALPPLTTVAPAATGRPESLPPQAGLSSG